MTVFPIIARELRSAARQPFSYHLRVLGVAVMILASVVFGMENGFENDRGGALFGSLHFALFLAIWILVPFLTADCISRERREGTLGLLFLTELTAGGVVVAKGIAHGVRSITLWLAVLPILAIPILMGGVSWTQVLLSALIDFSAILWALSAGLLASAWSKTWLRSLLNASILAAFFFLCMAYLTGTFVAPVFSRRGFTLSYYGALFNLVTGVGFMTNSLGMWPVYLRLSASGQVIAALVKVAAFSVIWLGAIILLAGARIRRIWQEEPPSARQLWLQATFCRPILWVNFLQRWMRWKLEHNPVGWLGQRTWSGRLVTWGWFAVIVSFYSVAFTDSGVFRAFSTLQTAVAWALALTIAASSAGSFRRERESGVLELLLVSPVGEESIIFGRLRGLWGQFLPTMGLLLAVWFYFSSIFVNFEDTRAIFFHAVTFITLPVIGLYFSLRCRNFVNAFLCTLAIGVLLPLLMPPSIGLLKWLFFDDENSYFKWQLRLSGWTNLCQIGLALYLLPRLHARLRSRSFVLGAQESSQ